MSTSATLPSTIHIRPSRLAGLLVAVAIVAGVTTWSVSQVTTESHARSSLQSDVVPSPGFATMGYDHGVTGLTLDQQAACTETCSRTNRSSVPTPKRSWASTSTTSTRPSRTS